MQPVGRCWISDTSIGYTRHIDGQQAIRRRLEHKIKETHNLRQQQSRATCNLQEKPPPLQSYLKPRDIYRPSDSRADGGRPTVAPL